MGNLDGKAALVTGASRGVGAEIARLLAPTHDFAAAIAAAAADPALETGATVFVGSTDW